MPGLLDHVGQHVRRDGEIVAHRPLRVPAHEHADQSDAELLRSVAARDEVVADRIAAAWREQVVVARHGDEVHEFLRDLTKDGLG